MSDASSAGQTGTLPPSFRTLQLDLLDADPQQPRKHFDPAALEALGQSILDEGLLQPIVVRPKADGRFEVVAGERRMRAATMFNVHAVSVIVREDLVGRDVLLLQLTENLQREDLPPADLGAGVARMVEMIGAQGAAKMLKKSEAWVSTHAALVKLPEPVKNLVESGAITSPDVAVTLGKLQHLDPKTAENHLRQFSEAAKGTSTWASAPTRVQVRAALKTAEDKIERQQFNKAEKQKERAELSALKEKAKTDPKAKAKLEKLQKENAPDTKKAAEAAVRKAMGDYTKQADAFIRELEAALYKAAKIPQPKQRRQWDDAVCLSSDFHGSDYNPKRPPASVDAGDFNLTCRGVFAEISALARIVNAEPKLTADMEDETLTIIEAKKIAEILGSRVTFKFEGKATGKKLRSLLAAPANPAAAGKAPAPPAADDPFGVAAFVTACVVKAATDQHRVNAADLHKAYARFVAEHPDIDRMLGSSDKRWGAAIKAAGLKVIRSNGMKYTGIKLAVKS